MTTILEYARDFITTRLSDTNSANDGQQTPKKNHPVFITQAAALAVSSVWKDGATSQKLSRPLGGTEKQIDYIVEVNKRWLVSQSVWSLNFYL
jgi:hypothetical protein